MPEDEDRQEEEARLAEEAEREAEMERFARVLTRQQKNVVYPDYQTKEDFTLWLQGFREKIKAAYNFTAQQEEELKAEVLRSISGRLKPGTPLDTYNRLTPEVKANYNQLVEKLTNTIMMMY